MKPGPITSLCAPAYSAPVYKIESYVPGRYRETVESESVKEGLEEDAFESECARIEAVRASETVWEPIVVRLLCDDLEERRKIIA